MTIDQFKKSAGYRWLSNFEPSLVEYEGQEYPTVEHAYQAAKTDSRSERKRIREAKTPREAKNLGQKVTLMNDWEYIKVDVMYQLVKQKFFRHEALGDKLLETGEHHLVENTSGWNDRFWGVADGFGQNHLGRILMDVREELRQHRDNS